MPIERAAVLPVSDTTLSAGKGGNKTTLWRLVAWWRGGVIFRPSVKRLFWRFELSEHVACVITRGNSTRIAQPGTLQTVEKITPPRHHATSDHRAVALTPTRSL